MLPAWMLGVIQRPWAAPWYKGMQVYIRDLPGFSWRYSATLWPVFISRAVHMIVAFGRPVVPDV